jgi:hypothetical protein
MPFLADENFNGRILRGLWRENPDIDIVHVQDTAAYQADDPTVLEWVAQAGRILLTHNVQTIPNYAYQRVRDGKLMPGVIAAQVDIPIGQVIDDLLLAIGASDPSEYENQVVYLPLT